MIFIYDLLKIQVLNKKKFLIQLQKNFMQGGITGQILGITLIACRNPITKKFLAVNEKNGSWWVAGGRVDAPEAFTNGAIRQCKEQAGIDVQIKGILRIEQSPGLKFSRLKIVFYGEPKDPNQIPKNYADKESLGAAYLSSQQILALKPKWRGPELYSWARYLEEGGRIHPLSMLREIQVEK